MTPPLAHFLSEKVGWQVLNHQQSNTNFLWICLKKSLQYLPKTVACFRKTEQTDNNFLAIWVEGWVWLIFVLFSCFPLSSEIKFQFDLQSCTKWMEKLYPFSPKNQGWQNGTFWLLCGFIRLDLGGWVLLFHFYSVQDCGLWTGSLFGRRGLKIAKVTAKGKWRSLAHIQL